MDHNYNEKKTFSTVCLEKCFYVSVFSVRVLHRHPECFYCFDLGEGVGRVFPVMTHVACMLNIMLNGCVHRNNASSPEKHSSININDV